MIILDFIPQIKLIKNANKDFNDVTKVFYLIIKVS